MSVSLVPEDEVRAALQPFRPDRGTFEAAVRERLKEAEERQAKDPLWRASPLLKSAAAFLPLQVLAGCNAAPAAAKMTSAAGGYKLLSYLLFPAISLLALLSAAVFSARKIRSIHEGSSPGLNDAGAMREAISQWWRENKWAARFVFAVTMALAVLGASWLLFVLYIVSFGLLVYVLSSLARLGLGNRQLIARSCMMGLMFLGPVIPGIGFAEIHFIDQSAVTAVFVVGVLILFPFAMGIPQLMDQRIEKPPRWMWAFAVGFGAFQVVLACLLWSLLKSPWIVALLLAPILIVVGPMIYQARYAGKSRPAAAAIQWGGGGLMAVLVVPLIAFLLNPVLWPATRSRMKRHVESFAAAPFQSSSWHNWEIVARRVIDLKLDPDMSQPRRLVAEEIAGEQNPYVLGSAVRTGLLRTAEMDQLRDYQSRRRDLVDHPPGTEPQAISSLPQRDWVIRAAVMRDDLSPAERDYLAKRLHATLEELASDQYVTLKDVLLATQLLNAIGRPVEPGQYRALVHELLRKFHTKNTGGFRAAGGFKTYLVWPATSWVMRWRGQPGAVDSTEYAVELMEIYGVPDNLDLIWVRSFLRPSCYGLIGDQKWIAAAALDRLNQLPGVRRPGWIEVAYYERSLLAACVLVGLCVYATLISPPGRALAVNRT